MKTTKQASYLFKIAAILLLISLTLYNCSDEALILKNKKVAINNTPQKIPLEIALQEIRKYNKKATNKENTIFDQINSNTLVNKSVVNNLITYSFLLKPINHFKTESNNLFFDNLFVNIDKQGNLITHILRYTPTHNWLLSDKNLNKYSGTVAYLSKNRIVVSSLNFNNGKVQATENKKATTIISQKGGCRLKFVMRVCGALEGDSGKCTSFYELICPKGSGNGNSNSDNGIEENNLDDDDYNNYLNNQNGTTNGGGTNSNFSNGNENTFGGVPILDGCTYGSNIDPATGLCVKIDDDKIDASELTGKAKCLNDKLTKNGNTFIKDILKKFQGSSKFDINIKSVDKIYRTSTAIELNGQTTYTKGSSLINIKISTSKLSNMPALAAIRTLIHEYIHADMFRKINTTNYNGDLDFKTTYEKFKQSNYEATPQHNTMAELYIHSVKDALKDFHKNILTSDYNYLTDNGTNPLPDNFYEALAWQGLKNTQVKAYSDLSDTKKTELTNALNNYYHSTTKKCPN